MYDPADPVENLRQTREVAAWLRNARMDPHQANILALLGGLLGTDGAALHQAARGIAPGQAPSFDLLRQLAISGGGQRIAGSLLTVEEAFARLAALGYEPSIPPVAYHCLEDGCHARAQLMIDELLLLGVGRDSVRRAWAFSERAAVATGAKMQPTSESGAPHRDYQGAVIEFDYHVAPAVLAEGAGGAVEWRVLDPSLVARPAAVGDWHLRVGTPMHRPLSAQLTELGVPPVHPGTGTPFPGTGYRPWRDPPLPASQDAERRMVDLMAADRTVGRPVRPLPLL